MLIFFQGLDAQIYQAAKQSGKYDLMLVPIQVERTGCGGCGEETNKNYAEEFIDEDSDAQFGTWVVDPSEPVSGGRNNQSYAAFTKDPLEGTINTYMTMNIFGTYNFLFKRCRSSGSRSEIRSKKRRKSRVILPRLATKVLEHSCST